MEATHKRQGTTRVMETANRHDTRDLTMLAQLLDDRFTIPGTDFRFGLDGIIGLIPGIGDTITAAMGAYIIIRARELGARRRTRLRMAWNLLVDWLVGTIPLLGDIFDFAWKANRKNIRLLQEEGLLEQDHP